MDLQSARRGNYRKAGRAQRRERGKRDGSAAVVVSDDVHRSPMHACNCKGTYVGAAATAAACSAVAMVHGHGRREGSDDVVSHCRLS